MQLIYWILTATFQNNLLPPSSKNKCHSFLPKWRHVYMKPQCVMSQRTHQDVNLQSYYLSGIKLQPPYVRMLLNIYKFCLPYNITSLSYTSTFISPSSLYSSGAQSFTQALFKYASWMQETYHLCQMLVRYAMHEGLRNTCTLRTLNIVIYIGYHTFKWGSDVIFWNVVLNSSGLSVWMLTLRSSDSDTKDPKVLSSVRLKSSMTSLLWISAVLHSDNFLKFSHIGDSIIVSRRLNRFFDLVNVRVSMVFCLSPAKIPTH